MKQVRTAVLLLHGLGQLHGISDGLLTLQRRLAPLNLAYLNYTWWKVSAARIAKEIAEALPKRVILVGHSYGIWKQSFVEKELAKHAIRVYALVSADGVSRDHPRVLKFSGNVERLHCWRQENSRIKGSRWEASSATKVFDHGLVDCKHWQCDELPAFQDLVFKLAGGTE